MKTSVFALTGMLLVSSAVGRTQSPPAAPDTHQMMAGRQQMMSMQAADKNDKKLDDLVAQLNAARGNDRLDKVIAVVNELVAERKGMREMMARHDGMMGAMMKNGAAPKTGDDHSAHHPDTAK
jgi:hypothetical protein